MRIILFLALIIFYVECGYRTGNRNKNFVGKTGKVLGNGLASFFKDLNKKPEAMPKGYKYEPPKP